jgi:hypothetical protein
MASAGALMTVVALTLSSAISLPPSELSLSPVLTFTKSETHRCVATARTAALLAVAVAVRAARLRAAGISLATEIHTQRGYEL